MKNLLLLLLIIIWKNKIKHINILYANDNRKIKYLDIINYLKCKGFNHQGIYSNDADKKHYKANFIAYQYEKIDLIKKYHELTIHKGIHSLYNLIKESEFWWYGIYENIKKYIKRCVIFQTIHKKKPKKPTIIQIFSNGPRERNSTDLINVTTDIDDKNHIYNFIINIIDHYTKLVGSYLLVKKTAVNVLNCINNFISIYGEPNIIQCDNGYCLKRNINLIHSSVKTPTTNGVCEMMHQDIVY
jgi:hypothetical protein